MLLDTNGNYALDLYELSQIPPEMLKVTAAQLLDRFDVDGDGDLSFAELAAAGRALAVHPPTDTATADPSLLDTASQLLANSKSKQRSAALSRVHGGSTVDQSADTQTLSRVLAPKGDCCFRDEVALNNRCYPACKPGERIVSLQDKVFCADNHCSAQSTCKTAPTAGGACSDVCVHCTKSCPSQRCVTDFCVKQGQNGCWFLPPQSGENGDYSCDIGDFTGGVYYEEPINQRLNLPIGDPRACSQVYWDDDTIKPRGA